MRIDSINKLGRLLPQLVLPGKAVGEHSQFHPSYQTVMVKCCPFVNTVSCEPSIRVLSDFHAIVRSYRVETLRHDGGVRSTLEL